MADNTREEGRAPTSTDSAPAATALKKFPKGVVLGKDGKPCRSCTSFADWASQTKKVVRHSSTSSTAIPSTSIATTTSLAPPSDCPPDVEVLGRSTWTLLHSIAASYPTSPTPAEQKNISQFLTSFAKLYPCWVCAEDFQAYMEREKVRVESRDEFGRWMCEAHNEVSRKLGKEEFDCSRWEERWRTGWKDGRCE